MQAADSHPVDAIRLAADLAPILVRARALDDAVTVAAAAERASRHTANPTLVALAWNDLGLALQEVRRSDEAITALDQALVIFRETGERYGEGMAWANLGAAHDELEEPDQARNAWERAVDLFDSTGDDELAARVRERLADLDGSGSSGPDGPEPG